MPFALYLSSREITDDGLKELAGLENLAALRIDMTGITDAGLKHLAGLKNLHTLNLSQTKITDAGLKHLAGLTNLQTLALTNTKVTDAGLKELKGLKKLGVLYLPGTAVTDKGAGSAGRPQAKGPGPAERRPDGPGLQALHGRERAPAAHATSDLAAHGREPDVAARCPWHRKAAPHRRGDHGQGA